MVFSAVGRIVATYREESVSLPLIVRMKIPLLGRVRLQLWKRCLPMVENHDGAVDPENSSEAV